MTKVHTKFRSLGHPIHTQGYVAAAYDAGTADRGPRMYAVSCGKIATVQVIDVFTGVCVESYEMDGSTHCWGIQRLPDGTLYMGSAQGNFYRLEPGGEKAEHLGLAIAGETFIWRIKADEDGVVYGGTFPNGKVFSYDPAGNRFRDYGQIVEGEKYVRSLAVIGDTVLAGIGTQRAWLIAIDKHSGEKREIPLPVDKVDGEMVYDLTVVDDRAYVRLSPSNVLLVFDWTSQQWIDRVEGVMGMDVSAPHPDTGELYFVQNGRLTAYRPEERATSPTSFECEAARDFGWIRWYDQDMYPGWSLISATLEGGYWVYNPQTDRGELRETDAPGQENKIQSLAIDEQGRLLVGGYFSGGFAIYDPRRDETTEFGSVGQPEGMVSFKGQIYLGIYPYAKMFRFDPRQEWAIGRNPELLFALKDRGQDRPFAFIPAGNELAIGTVPYYGTHGGALTLYDPETGNVELHRHIVQNQSVLCLEYKDGMVFGGTTVLGGLGTHPVESSARVFAWDTRTRSKTSECAPVPDAGSVYAIAFDDRGQLWGMTDAHLFRMDPAGLDVKEVVAIDAFLPEKPVQWRGWHAGGLWAGRDGDLYGYIQGMLFRYSPSGRRGELLQDDIGIAKGDRAGNVYFTRNTELFLLRTD